MIKSNIPSASSKAWDLRAPERQTTPLIFSSPHSGRDYPADFVAASRLSPVQLRRSEDAFVDEIFAAAPDLGAPLLRALFPRAFVDANREAYELDPDMFDRPLPDFVRTKSVRIAAGLGTIPKVVADGAQINDRPLTFDEAKARIDAHHLPYHRKLSTLIDETVARFGGALVIDCHSMPSAQVPATRGRSLKNVDMVLGDCHGMACAPAITKAALETLTELGYRVRCNRPYAGGYITRHYGRPTHGVHTLQIEINRALYMDEHTIQRGPGLPGLARDVSRLIKSLSGVAERVLTSHHIADAAE